MEPSLSIVICTFRRNGFLRELLDALAPQLAEVPAEIVVVDNDAAAGARDVVPASLRYVHEPRPGVSHARNRGAAEARSATVLFLDDDQLVAPGFLAALVNAWHARPLHQRGLRLRVCPRPEPGVHSAPLHSALLERFAAADYTPVERGGFGTGGLVIERAILLAHPFHPALGVGEDTDFFLRTSEDGYHFGHLSSVSVHERITAERDLRWLITRQFQAGRIDAALDIAASTRAPPSSAVDRDLALQRLLLAGEREGFPGALPPRDLPELRATLRATLALRHPLLSAARALTRLPLALLKGGPAAALELQHLAYAAGRMRARAARGG